MLWKPQAKYVQMFGSKAERSDRQPSTVVLHLRSKGDCKTIDSDTWQRMRDIDEMTRKQDGILCDGSSTAALVTPSLILRAEGLDWMKYST